MSLKIEVGKKYPTRDGREATVAAYNPDALPYEQYIGWIGGCAVAWHKDGRRCAISESDRDLILSVPERVTMWGNHYRYANSYSETYWHKSKEEADGAGASDRTALLRCDFEDGIPVPGTLEIVK